MINENKYIVYKHVFPNGKSYIGITKREPEERWNYGKGYKTQPKIYNAIKKYGWENIDHFIIAKNLYEKEAKELEENLIIADDTIVNGYNQSFGAYSDVTSQTNNKYLQIYNAFLGNGAFKDFLEITKNEELLENMVKFALKQGKKDKNRNLQANIGQDIFYFSNLCDMFLALRYLIINKGSAKSIEIVKNQAKEYNKEYYIEHCLNGELFNPHERALKNFMKKEFNQ